jgi:surface polysaccharide O-acyltransferase-like enzyme
MKVLPMLDHVMLWVARAYAVLTFSATVYDSFKVGTPGVIDCLMVILPVLWLACLWQFNRPVCRWVLGISSSLLLIYLLSLTFLGLASFRCFLPMVGLAATLWTALRGGPAQRYENLSQAT